MKVRKFALYAVSPFLSFFAGFAVYLLTLKLVWDETIGREWTAVMFYAAGAYVLVCIPVYFGVIYFIKKQFKKYKALLYPFGCMFIFFIPTLFITLQFGSADLFSPEAVLFHSFFL